MKRLFLPLVFAAALGSPQTTHAALESTYTVDGVTYYVTPINSTTELTEDAQYIITSYSTWTTQNVFTHTSETTADWVTTHDDAVTASNFTSALWSLETLDSSPCPITDTTITNESVSESHSDKANVKFKYGSVYLPWALSSLATTATMTSSDTYANAEVVQSSTRTTEAGHGVFYVHYPYGTNSRAYLLHRTSGLGSYSLNYNMTKYYNSTYSGYITIYKVTTEPPTETVYELDGLEYTIKAITEPSEIVTGDKYIIKTFSDDEDWAGDYVATHDDTNGNLVWVKRDSESLTLASSVWTAADGDATSYTCPRDSVSSSYKYGSDSEAITTEQHVERQVCTFMSGDKYLPWGGFSSVSLTQALQSDINAATNAEVVKSHALTADEGSVFYIHHGAGPQAFLFCNNWTYGTGVGGFSSEFNMTLFYSATLSGYVQIYKLVNPIENLKSEYKAKLPKPAAYGVTDFDISGYENRIDALTASSADELTAAETEMQSIVDEAIAAANAAIIDRFNGKLFTVKNCGYDTSTSTSDYYMGGTNSVNTAYSAILTDRSQTVGPMYVWKFNLTGNLTDGFTVNLYNPFAELYMSTALSGSNYRVTMGDAAVDYSFKSNATDGSKFLIYTSLNGVLYYLHNNRISPAQLYNDANYLTNANTNWYITELTAEQQSAVYSTVKTEVAALGSDMTFGDMLGQYKSDLPSMQTEFAEFTDDSDFETVATAYNQALKFTAALNMPADGTYLRIKGADGYVTADQDVHDSADAPTAASVMWYSGETLVDYQNGFAFTNDGEFGDADDLAANVATTISIGEASTEVGKYKVTYGEQVTDGDRQHTYADGLGLSKVASLPVTLPSDGKATLIVPVALQIPDAEGCSFYVAVISDDDYTIRIHKATAGEVYAAHTAIIINGTADTVVDMPIAYDAETADKSYAREASGSTLRTAFTATEDFTTYAKQTAASVASAKRRTAAADGGDAVSVTFTALTDEVPANTVLFELPNTDKLATSHESITATMPTGTVAETDDVIFNAVEGKTVTTSISELTADSLPVDDAIYDLMGRRVVNPGHGIFIKNNNIFRK